MPAPRQARFGAARGFLQRGLAGRMTSGMPRVLDDDSAVSARQRRAVRNGLLVVCACLAVSTLFALALKQRYKSELLAIGDLNTGLIYFMEQNAGRFPASEAEFLASPFVERLPDGAFRVRARPDSAYRRETYGYPIRDLGRFEIQWGADLSASTLDQRGKVVDAEQRPVKLVLWPSSPNSAREYSRLLFEVSRRARQAAAHGHQTLPVPAHAP
jgi:hypothetical protein